MTRRALRIEIAVVLAVTFGLSAYSALVRLAEAVILGLSGQKVTLHERRSPIDLIDLALNLSPVFELTAWVRWACTCCGAVVFHRQISDSAG